MTFRDFVKNIDVKTVAGVIAMATAAWALLVVLFACFGCSSSAPCVCPKVNPPKVVYMPVQAPPEPLPTPRPPEAPSAQTAATLSVSQAISHYISEIERAYLECTGTIKAHNASKKVDDDE